MLRLKITLSLECRQYANISGVPEQTPILVESAYSLHFSEQEICTLCLSCLCKFYSFMFGKCCVFCVRSFFYILLKGEKLS
jgi:hypothetical protein